MNHTMYRLIGVAAISLLILTGCISRRVEPVHQLSLTEENSQEVSDEKSLFSLRIPNDFELTTQNQQADARLLVVSKKDTQPPESRVFIEENATPVDQAINRLVSQEAVVEQSREDITINENEGKKISVSLAAEPDIVIPYYFIRVGDKTYVFSLGGGQEWEYFDAVANSLKLVK